MNGCKSSALYVCLLTATACLLAAQQATVPGSSPAPAQAQPGTPAPQRVPLASQVPPNTQTAQPLGFESHGLYYEALTKDGITVMFALLPPQIKEFSIVQVTITNGSLVSWTAKPTDFSFVRQDGTSVAALTADEVVESLLDKAGRNDVIKLQMLYENSIYALSNYRPTNGYEQRREAAMAQFVNMRFTAAAAASAIALAPIRLKPGDSTDGAIFFENHGREKALGTGLITAHTCGQSFTFQVVAEPKVR